MAKEIRLIKESETPPISFCIKRRIKLELLVSVLLVSVFYLWKGCPILYFSGISCPGCGITRACLSIITLNFAAALYWHPLVFLLPILGGVLVLRPALPYWARLRKWLLVGIGAAFVVVYLWRMFWGDGQVVLVGRPAFLGDIRSAFTYIFS